MISLRESSKKLVLAFSKVELMVVVVCIIILGIVGYTWCKKAVAVEKRKECQRNIQALLVGFSGFVAASNRLPTAARSSSIDAADWIYWQADRSLLDSSVAMYIPGFSSKILRCPLDAQVRHREYPYSYSMNAHLEGVQVNRIEGAENRNKLILLYEEESPNDGACAPGELFDKLTTRHSRQSNAGFLDGRVELIDNTAGDLPLHFLPKFK